MGSVLPETLNQKSVKTTCPKCGTRVQLRGDEYDEGCKDYNIYWDCPLCGRVLSRRSLTFREHLANGLCTCFTAMFTNIEDIIGYVLLYVGAGGFIAVLIVFAGMAVCAEESEQDAPYKFYVREDGSTDIQDYYSQIEPYVNDNGELIYVNVYGEYRILDGYELIEVVEQNGEKDETD